MSKLNPNLKHFWKTKADTKVLKGGRSSSKTWDTAGFSIYLASKYKVKFLCIRQFQNKIAESVYAVLVIQIEKMGLLDEFDILKTSIKHKVTGSEFHFYGMHRNVNEIKGFEGADICWIEEAEALTKEQWSIIEPTLRKEGAEAWILYNPRLVTDFVESFKHDPKNGVIVRHINYDENPFLSNTMLKKIKRMKENDYEEYEHIYLGIPKEDSNESIIKRSWLEACINAHIKLDIEPSGKKVLGFDIADSGEDLCAYVHRHGQLCDSIEEWKAGEDELNRSAKKVFSEAMKDHSLIVYDSIGVGASAGSNFRDFNNENGRSVKNLMYKKFNAGDAVQDPKKLYDIGVKNKDFFSNLKAQAWWDVAQRCKKTYNAVTKGDPINEDEIISLSSELPDLRKLIDELSTPNRDFDKSGKVKVESKDDLKKRKVKSPNIADAFIMSFFNMKSSAIDAMMS